MLKELTRLIRDAERRVLPLCFVASLILWAPYAPGAERVFQLLQEFSRTNGGPVAPWELVQAQDGSFYGSSEAGGSNGCGTIFRITPTGVITTLFSFEATVGQYPQGGLIEGADGQLYGTTYQDSGVANGTLFRMSPQGIFTNLHRFDCAKGEGIGPACRLMQTPTGEIYGTTFYGGASGCGGNSAGTIFKLTTNGVFTTLVSFSRTNGSNPQCGLVSGEDGALFGSTTGGGGPLGDAYGTIFRLNANGDLATLHTFDYPTDGSLPSGNLLFASDGNIYGTTEYGTNNEYGTIFKMTPEGALTTLLNFNATNGSYPHGDLIQTADGCIYGRTISGGTYDYGTLFALTTNGAFTTILSFDGTNGANPWAGLVMGRDGNVYGTTAGGIDGADGGVAFRLVPQPVLTALRHSNQLLVLSWTSFTNGVYQVETSPGLAEPNWTPVSPDITATNSSTDFTLSSDASRNGYFRVILRPWTR